MTLRLTELGQRMNHLGLAGVTHQVSFTSSERLAAAVSHLLRCHPHHFAVLPNKGNSVAVSRQGLTCIEQALRNRKLHL